MYAFTKRCTHVVMPLLQRPRSAVHDAAFNQSNTVDEKHVLLTRLT